MSLTSYRAAPPRASGIGSPGQARGHYFGQRLTPFGGPCNGWIGGPGGDLLSRALRHSTMGAGGFHGRVRDGIGCGPPAKATRSSSPSVIGLNAGSDAVACPGLTPECAGLRIRSEDMLRMISMHGVPGLVTPGTDLELYRAIRTSQLRALPRFHTWPINVMVYHGPRGDLVSRWVSRLDAFSGYPVRT